MEQRTDTRDLQRLSDGKKLLALLEDVFTDEFMRTHTRFDSFEGFRYSSAVILNWQADTIIYSKTLLDSFVRESTDFPDWDSMVRRAAQLRFHKEA